MPDFFDYDPLKGVTSFFDYDDATGIATIRKVQDNSLLLDYAAEARNAGLSDRKYKKSDWALYCYIPEWLEIELMKRGLSIDRVDDHRKILSIINREFPAMKMTDKTHA
jgi:hypothetical protein